VATSFWEVAVTSDRNSDLGVCRTAATTCFRFKFLSETTIREADPSTRRQSVMSSARRVIAARRRDAPLDEVWHWVHQVDDKIEFVTSPILADYNGPWEGRPARTRVTAAAKPLWVVAETESSYARFFYTKVTTAILLSIAPRPAPILYVLTTKKSILLMILYSDLTYNDTSNKVNRINPDHRLFRLFLFYSLFAFCSFHHSHDNRCVSVLDRSFMQPDLNYRLQLLAAGGYCFAVSSCLWVCGSVGVSVRPKKLYDILQQIRNSNLACS